MVATFGVSYESVTLPVNLNRPSLVGTPVTKNSVPEMVGDNPSGSAPLMI